MKQSPVYIKKEVQKMPVQKDINLEQIYKMISALQRDVALIKKCIIEEPEFVLILSKG